MNLFIINKNTVRLSKIDNLTCPVDGGPLFNFASRLKLIRSSLLNQSREEFSSYINIPEITIRSWETKKASPSDTSLTRLVQSLNERSLMVTKEWLKEGTGPSPLDYFRTQPQNNDQNKCIIQIKEGLKPFFKAGDSIHCIEVNCEEIEHKDIIITSKDSNDFIAKALRTEDEELFISPMVKNDMGPMLRFNKKKDKVFKIIGFERHSEA